jgi:hypothetical protein
MISAKIILDKRSWSKKNNGFPLKIQINKRGVKNPKFVLLNKYMDKIHWNDVLLKSHPEYRILSAELKKREFRLLEEVNYCNDNNLNLEDSKKVIEKGIVDNAEVEIYLLKKRIQELESDSGIGVLEFYDIRIEELKAKRSPYKFFESTKKEIDSYLDNDIPINKITYEWLNDFINYKASNGTDQPGIMAYLRNLRSVYKEAQRRTSYSIKKDNPFLGLIKTIARKKPLPELTDKEFLKIKNYEAIKNTREINRYKLKRNASIWLLQFLIGGHDYADIACLEWTNIKNGRLKFSRFKNRNKPSGNLLVDVKLYKLAKQIIEQYGDKSTARIFSFIPHPTESNYNDFTGNINRSLASISKTLELSYTIKTKSTRYLFRSRAGEQLIHDLIIMKIQGHKPKGVTFSYQGNISKRIQDAEHKKVVNFLLRKSY